LRFKQSLEKLSFFMQSQDDASVFLFKLWPRIEANKKPIIAGAIIIATAAAAIWIFSEQRDQKEIAAGEALTKLAISQTVQPDAFLKIAGDYSGTLAAQRAQIEAATMLFESGNYADAQTQFQKYLDDHSDGGLAGQAMFGVAASLDAQGKADLASSAYQRAINNASDPVIMSASKLGLAKILEAQGKYDSALNYFQEVIRANQNNSLGNDAMWHFMQLKNKVPAAAPAPAMAQPVSLQSVK
jgi:TolA-binding protein